MSNLSTKIVHFPPYIKEQYGVSYVDERSVRNLGYALLTIAGADGEVSEAEMNRLINDHISIGVPEEIIKSYKVFDYKNANWEELLPDIQRADMPFNVARTLIHDAIKMSRADFEFADEEKMAVKKAVKLLEVPDDILLALNRLVDMEEALNAMGRALMETDKL